jgi:hypothetical protein
MQELTVWVTPFTRLESMNDAIAMALGLARPDWHANLLIPLHFGQWPQSQCRQSIPKDMLVSNPQDAATIRGRVEAYGLGFGGWGVPRDGNSPELAGRFAEACGYYSANFEPDEFWLPGDNAAAINDWWSRFWNAMQDQDSMSGNVSATVVPNSWGISAFANSLGDLAAGCGALALEVYGGLQTRASYPAPNLWPTDGFQRIRNTGVDANLIPIVALDNLPGQYNLAARLGHGNVHVWAI